LQILQLRNDSSVFIRTMVVWLLCSGTAQDLFVIQPSL
jgi:hypothetical protein